MDLGKQNLKRLQIGFVDLHEFVKEDASKQNFATQWKSEHNATGPMEPTLLALLLSKFFAELEQTDGTSSTLKRVTDSFAKVPDKRRVKVGFKMRTLDLLGESEEEERTKLFRFVSSLHFISHRKIKYIFLHRNALMREVSTREAKATNVYHPERLSEDKLEKYLNTPIHINPRSLAKVMLRGCVWDLLAERQLREFTSRFPDASEYLDVTSESLGNPFLRESVMKEIVSFLLRSDENVTEEWRGMNFEETFSYFLPKIHRPPNVQGRSGVPFEKRIQNAAKVLEDALSIVLSDDIHKYLREEREECRGKVGDLLSEEMRRLPTEGGDSV